MRRGDFEAWDGSGTMRAPGIYGREQLGAQGKDEAWRLRTAGSGGVRRGNKLEVREGD